MIHISFTVSAIVVIHCTIEVGRLFINKLPARYGLTVDKILVDGEYGRLWSASWIYTHRSHLFINTFVLVGIGFGIDWPFGTVEFLFVYFTSQLGGNLLALYTYREDRSGQYDAVGAAGGISGVLFAAIALQPSLNVSVLGIGSLPIWPIAIVFLVVSVFVLKPYSSTMIHDAHLGGAIIGLLITPLVASDALHHTLGIAVVISIPTVVLFYAWVKAPENIILCPDNKSTNSSELEDATPSLHEGYETAEHEMNVLLDKINQQGYHSLSQYERARLHSIAHKPPTGLA